MGKREVPVVMQRIKGSRVATAVVQFAAVAWIRSLAQELPYAAGAVVKTTNHPPKKERTEKKFLNVLNLRSCMLIYGCLLGSLYLQLTFKWFRFLKKRKQ